MGKKYRVFSFSNRKCPKYPCGGPSGVNFRLYLANRRLHYIDNMVHIFEDAVLDNGTKRQISVEAKRKDGKQLRYYEKLNERYHFSVDDVYIFQDVMSAAAFCKMYPVKNTVLVYHQQGSLYKEMVYFNSEEDDVLKTKLDKLFATTVSEMKYIAFPSKGSIESLIESEPMTQKVLEGKNTKILYNGCDGLDNPAATSDVAQQVIQIINETPVPAFISVATLNAAKGVERIPEYLASLKEIYGDFLWIVIGKGMKEQELSSNIEKYGLKDNTLWIRESIPNEDVLSIYQCTDFYIMAHRLSIFDFATIEAMRYGNIPILTPVGGNKEMIQDNSGIFMNDFKDVSDFVQFMNTQDINEAREKNEQLARRKFSEEAFLKRYAELVWEIQN